METLLRNTIGILLVIVVIFGGYGCTKRFLNPKCDSMAIDAFHNFIQLYGSCGGENNEGVCKCGDFDIDEVPLKHKIVISPAIDRETKESSVRVSLVCKGINDDDPSYFKRDSIMVYFSDPKNFEAKANLRIYKDIEDKIRKEGPISEDILGGGFEIEGGISYIKNVGTLLGYDSTLTLVNYNGEVAFMAETLTQDRYLRDNPLALTLC